MITSSILTGIYFYVSVFWIKFAIIYFCKWLFDKLFAKNSYCDRQREEPRKNEECFQVLTYVTGYAVVWYYLVLYSISLKIQQHAILTTKRTNLFMHNVVKWPNIL